MQYPTALYGRTSKDDGERLAIEIQQRTLREWAVRDSVEVVEEFWDADISGKLPLFDRPRGKKLLDAIRAGKVQAVAVVYIDRFGRTLLDGLQAAAELEKLGVKIVAVQDGWDARRGDDPMFFQFRLMIAEAEHRRIKERMQAGKNRASERDNAPPGGSLIFGYRMGPSGHYVPDPVEAGVVVEVFRRFLAGQSQKDILRYLQSTGLPSGRRVQKRTPGAAVNIRRGDSGVWTQATVSHMLRQRAYVGERRWGGKVYPCPPLIDAESFERVQAILRGYTTRRAHGQPKGLLSGLFVCANCGERFYYKRHSRSDREYYACEGAARLGRGCKARVIPVGWLDDLVWEEVRSAAQNPEVYVRKMLAASEDRSASAADLAADEERLTARLGEIDAAVQAVWAEQEANGWPVSWVSKKLNKLNAEREHAAAQAAELRKRRSALLLDHEQLVAAAGSILGVVVKLGLRPSFKRKYNFIRFLVAGGTIRTEIEGRTKKSFIEWELRWGETGSPDSVGTSANRIEGTPTLVVTALFPDR